MTLCYILLILDIWNYCNWIISLSKGWIEFDFQLKVHSISFYCYFVFNNASLSALFNMAKPFNLLPRPSNTITKTKELFRVGLLRIIFPFHFFFLIYLHFFNRGILPYTKTIQLLKNVKWTTYLCAIFEEEKIVFWNVSHFHYQFIYLPSLPIS